VTEVVTLHFAWSPPSGRVQAAYRAKVLRREAEGDRCVCRLLELAGVERGGSGEEVSDAALRGLIGKCARVPGEALKGLTLPLKMATLAGGLTRPYFFDEE
jgi:hypothetical protein